MKGQNYGSTLNNCEGVLKSTNLLHKQGLFKTYSLYAVSDAIYFPFLNVQVVLLSLCNLDQHYMPSR